jgi:parallel beta-helix repeat protein
MLRIPFLLFTLLTALGAGAANWYVAPDGSDRNPGTLAAPFATLNQTDRVVRPGDTVYVRGGAYSQRVSLWRSGTATARITYRPYGSERVILDAGGQPGNGVTLGGSYVDWIGFEIRNARDIGLVGWGGHDQRLLNNVIHGCIGGGIWVGHDRFGLTHHVLISGNEVYNNVLENQARRWTSGWAQTIGVGRGNFITIASNKVYRNYGEGIVLSRTDNSRVAHNEVFDNYSVQIYLSHAQNCVVDGNLAYSTLNRSFYRTPTSNDPPHGIVLANEYNGISTNPTRGNQVINNTIRNTEWGLGFWKDPAEKGAHSMIDCRFANNTIIGATRFAVQFDADHHRGVVVENNTFVLRSPAVPTSATSRASGITFRNNTVKPPTTS